MPTNGWLLYDGSCGFCDRWVQFWKPIIGKRGFGVAPLQSDFVKARIAMPEDILLQDLRVLLINGKIISGANAYRYLMRRIFWAYPLFVLSIIPILSSLFDWGYRTFANHRHRVSKVCRISQSQSSDHS